MNYISLFSGIEAASVAWDSLGWNPVAFSEIEPFCCDLLAKRFPDVPNLGDVAGVDWTEYEGSVAFIKNPPTVVETGTPDAPRYKACGNSMAVPVINHIGRRIEAVDSIF